MGMDKRSRTYNSIVNSIVGIAMSMVTVVLNFVVRIVIVRQLGEEINGIHNLFQSITNTIALIEAGFSTAMVIHLYKPIQEGDRDRTSAIIKFYKQVYALIALVFFVVCAVVNIAFLPFMVKSSIPMYEVRLYFLIYMLITPLSYLTYSRVSILYAEQKNRVRFVSAALCELVFRGLQVILVFIFHNYYLFVALMIAEAVTCNLICGAYVNRNHGYLGSNKSTLPSESKREIFKTVKPIFINNISSNIQSSFKPILVSFLSTNVSMVGYFGNYQLISSTAQMLFSQFGGALTSSFGNLAVEGDKERMYQIYKKVSFILNSIAVVLCAGFICCIQPFIALCFGDGFLLPYAYVILLTVDLYILLVKVPIVSVQNAMGLHRYDQSMMIVQAFASVVLGLVMGIFFDIAGVLIGLLIPQLVCAFIYKGIIIYNKAFGKGAADFLKWYMLDMLKAIVIIAACVATVSVLSFDNLILDMIVKGVIALAISGGVIVLSSARSEEFKYCINMVIGKIRRK